MFFMKECGLLVNFPGLAGGMTPRDMNVFFDNFLGGGSISETADAAKWLATDLTTQATVPTNKDGADDTPDEIGGILLITLDDTSDEGVNLQVNGNAFALENDLPLYFETRVQIGDVSNLKFFVGLAVTHVEIITRGVTDRLGFQQN